MFNFVSFTYGQKSKVLHLKSLRGAVPILKYVSSMTILLRKYSIKDNIHAWGHCRRETNDGHFRSTPLMCIKIVTFYRWIQNLLTIVRHQEVWKYDSTHVPQGWKSCLVPIKDELVTIRDNYNH